MRLLYRIGPTYADVTRTGDSRQAASSSSSSDTIYTDARSHFTSSTELTDALSHFTSSTELSDLDDMHRRVNMAGFALSPFIPEDRRDFLVLQRHAVTFNAHQAEKRLALLEKLEQTGVPERSTLQVQPKDNLSCVLALPTSFNNSQLTATGGRPARWPTTQELQAYGRPRMLPNPSQLLHLEKKIQRAIHHTEEADSAYWEWPLPHGSVRARTMHPQDPYVYKETIQSMETLMVEISSDDAWKE